MFHDPKRKFKRKKNPGSLCSLKKNIKLPSPNLISKPNILSQQTPGKNGVEYFSNHNKLVKYPIFFQLMALFDIIF